MPNQDHYARTPKQIALAAGAYTAVNMTYYVFTTFVISFGTSPAFLGMSKNLFLSAVLIASLVQLVALPLAGALTDRVGRRTVYLAGAMLLGIFSFFFWPLLDTRSAALIIVALVVGLGVVHSMMYGPQSALFAETFSTRGTQGFHWAFSWAHCWEARPSRGNGTTG